MKDMNPIKSRMVARGGKVVLMVLTVLTVLALSLSNILITSAFRTVRAQTQEPDAPESPESPIETTIAAFATELAAKPTRTRTATPTRTPTATRTSTPTPTQTSTPTRTPTKPPPPTATRSTDTPTPAPTNSPAPTLTPQHTPAPTETPQITSTPNTLPVVRGYLPLVMREYPCNYAQPDCYEDNNGFAKAFGPLTVGQPYIATEDVDLDRYDYYTMTLTGGTPYTFTLTFPRNDVDLYVQGNGPAYAILAKSATAQDGGLEQVVFIPTITAQYFVLVYTFEAASAVNYQLQISNP